MTEEEKKFWQKAKEAVADFIYGMASHESARQALKTRGSMEHLFILITMGCLMLCRKSQHGSAECCVKKTWPMPWHKD